MGSTVLLVTTCRWYTTARLAIAFSDAGCRVDVVCPRGHPVQKARVVHKQYAYQGTRPLHSLQKAIDAARPDLIVPCDDHATMYLHQLHASSPSPETRSVIESSLGDPQSYPAYTARTRFLLRAHEAGIPVPDTAEVADLAALRAWLATFGYPAYLKVDASSGGVGVKLVNDIDSAQRAFEQLAAPPKFVRVIKRLLINSDTSLLLPFLKRLRSIVSVQKAIRGVEANSAIACWRGRLLACLSVQVLERRDAKGPATVVRIVENPQMRRTAEKVSTCFGLSGLFGLDYIIDEQTGIPNLIEFNGRATQTCHLDLGLGKNPVDALVGGVSGASPRCLRVTDSDTIALFPQEWKRDPASSYLRTGFHDVPWSYPDLVRACVKRRLHEEKWLSYEKWQSFWEPAGRRSGSQIQHPVINVPRPSGDLTSIKPPQGS